MDNWKTIRLGDACFTNSNSYSPRDNWRFINYLDTGNITDNRVGTIQYIDTESEIIPSRARRKVKKNSIVYSTVCPNQRHFGILRSLPDNFLVSTGFAVIDVNAEILNADFLYHLLTQPVIVEKLHTIAEQSTSTYPSIKPSDIENLMIDVPEIIIQEKIASILSAIDDKIEMNTAINDNLEQQAQALCEKWVLEHAESIIMRPLSEIAEINPDTYSPKDKWTFVNYLDTSSITNGVMSEIQLIRPDTEKLPSRARRIIKANDIVYSTVRPNQLHFGIISNPLDNMLASTGFAVIRSKYDYISSPYIYHFLTGSDFIEKMQQLAEQSTSTFPSVKPSDIGTCLIPCANETEMLDIIDKINGMYALISANHQENKHLSALRDTLLPKLMNGEIDVSRVEL